MSTTPMPMVQVFAPDGMLGDIPYDKLHDAIGAGAKIAAKIQAPDGTVGYVPADRRGEALKAGGKAVPIDLSDADGGKPGFWSTFGHNLKGMLTPSATSPYPGMDLEAKQAVAQQSIQQDAQRKAAGYSPLYRAVAPLGGSVPFTPDAAGLEQSAAQGDTAGVYGGVAAPIAAGAATAAVAHGAGPALDAAGNLIPSAGDVGLALRTPRGALRPGVRTTAKAVGAGAGALVGGGWGAMVGEHLGEGLANTLVPKLPTDIPVDVNPGGPLPDPAQSYAARGAEADAIRRQNEMLDRKNATAARLAAKNTPQSPIVTPTAAVPESEGRPATWKNQSVADLASTGNPLTRQAAVQAQLRQLDVPNVNLIADPNATMTPSVGAAKSVTRFDAQGNPIQLNSASLADWFNKGKTSPAEAYLQSLGRNVPEVEVDGQKGTAANASGESSASLEAQSRIAAEKSKGLQRVRIDTRSGKEIPLTGVDAVDAKPGPYDQIVMRDANGNEITLDQGEKATPRRPKKQ